jgi:hypothetical protein
VSAPEHKPNTQVRRPYGLFLLLVALGRDCLNTCPNPDNNQDYWPHNTPGYPLDYPEITKQEYDTNSQHNKPKGYSIVVMMHVASSFTRKLQPQIYADKR